MYYQRNRSKAIAHSPSAVLSLARTAVRMGLCTILVTAAVASASTISAPFAFNYFGPATGNKGSDTASAIGTVLSIDDNFTSIASGGGLQVTFDLAPSAGSTDYSVIKTVTNDTGAAWTDFQISWGCGPVGANPCPGFYPLTNDGSTPTSSAGGTFVDNGYEVLWNGLDIQSGSSVTFTFGVDTCPNCSGDWAIFQQASSVPEPGSLILGGIGLALTFVGRFRRRRYSGTRSC